MRNRIIGYAASIPAILLLSTTATVGCSCIVSYPPLLASYSSSDAVFVGKVRYVVKIPRAKEQDFRGDRIVTFEVKSRYKGILPETKLVSLYADYESSSCSFFGKGPRVGETWAVFADRMGEKPQMSFGGTCNRSNKIRSNDYAANFEKELFRFKEKQAIVGSILVNYLALANVVEAKVEGEGVSTIVNADSDGYFWFPLERPGTYRVTIKIPFAIKIYAVTRYPDKIDISKTESVLSYTVDLKEDQFDYNEVNVFKEQPTTP